MEVCKFALIMMMMFVSHHQESHTEATGQVYELVAGGQILVQWADKSQSLCYPQELYLIADEVSNGVGT